MTCRERGLVGAWLVFGLAYPPLALQFEFVLVDKSLLASLLVVCWLRRKSKQVVDLGSLVLSGTRVNHTQEICCDIALYFLV